ncbi:hypothetical protein BST83_02290 [Polaribacter filamentus]|jgi:hypothetical protein|uniref:Uncharacterized protein n=1 Tax=Polaribacter filamentus TaxID=53483 RepID=A0A2S7KU21_9FLAO|nr:hypothetical protein BST83_02290 [Polaribacter filamentus]
MASLNPSTSVLGARKAKHFLWLACFNYLKSTLNYLATFNPSQAVTTDKEIKIASNLNVLNT